MARLLRVQEAYRHMNNGDNAIEKNDIEAALREYGEAQRLYPENLEMRYWHAVSLANIGHLQQALPIFQEVFVADDHWRTLTGRLPASGLLQVDAETLQKILVLK